MLFIHIYTLHFDINIILQCTYPINYVTINYNQILTYKTCILQFNS